MRFKFLSRALRLRVEWTSAHSSARAAEKYAAEGKKIKIRAKKKLELELKSDACAHIRESRCGDRARAL